MSEITLTAGDTTTVTFTLGNVQTTITDAAGLVHCVDPAGTVTSLDTEGHTATTVNVDFTSLQDLTCVRLTRYECEIELDVAGAKETAPGDESSNGAKFVVWMKPDRN